MYIDIQEKIDEELQHPVKYFLLNLALSDFTNKLRTSSPQRIKSILYIFQILNNMIQYLTFWIQQFFPFDAGIWYHNK